MIFIIVILLIVIATWWLIYRKYYGVERFQDDIRVKVINLQRNHQRLSDFYSKYDLELTCDVFSAVDGRQLDRQQLYENSVIGDNAIQSMQLVDAGYRRYHHSDMSSLGGVGCYLSHAQLWREMVNNDSSMYCIFEDDVIASIKLQDIQQRLVCLPSDWHIYVFGRPHTHLEYEEAGHSCAGKLIRLKTFYGLHAYIINKRGAQWLLEHGSLFPIQMQIDGKLSSLTDQLIVYMHPEHPLLETRNVPTDIQVHASNPI